MHSPSPPMFDLNRFKALYTRFDQDTLRQLPQYYSANVVFVDPIHRIQGIDSLTQYFHSFCDTSLECRFDFLEELAGPSSAFLGWRMHYRHPQLAHGKWLQLSGTSFIKFDTHITYQEDFYDMGKMVYQHIPILGWILRKLNTRLAGKTL